MDHPREFAAGRPRQRRPLRPGWCYGTPGLARAQQLAALAVGDDTWQRAAETALARCLADPGQLVQITDTRLCHGWAGLWQTAWRAARDAATDDIARALAALRHHLVQHPTGPGAGLLEGDAGCALALRKAAHDTAPVSSWDACLLI